MNKQNEPLFPQVELGLGYHNVGTGLLESSNEDIIKKTDKIYGQRCGHIPLNAKTVGVLTEYPDEILQGQMAYLSALLGRELSIFTFEDLKEYTVDSAHKSPLVVPYGNTPRTEIAIKQLGGTSWGLPGKLTHLLKNKSEFYNLVEALAVDGYTVPDHRIADIETFGLETKEFLTHIEALYRQAGLQNYYPFGVMLRASDEDGNCGSSLAYMRGKYVIVVPNGDADKAKIYGNWDEALLASKRILLETMDPEKEKRVVISRFIDFAESPGMSLVLQNGEVTSLGWNGQLQMPGSKACVGTSTFVPKNKMAQKLQEIYEEQTSVIFETFLRKSAANAGVDFQTLNAVANTDIMVAGELELELQKRLGRPPVPFVFAECNPRWTNYTDAIMVVLGAEMKEQTVANMKEVITSDIATRDKYPLPKKIDINELRELIFEKDTQLKKRGTRLICRMARNPMGLIFAGDVELAEKELEALVNKVSNNEITNSTFLTS